MTLKNKLSNLQIFYTVMIAVFASVKIVLLPIMPKAVLLPTIVKALAAVFIVLFAVSGKRFWQDSFNRMIFLSLLLFLAADVLLKVVGVAGVVLFGLAHLLLAITFLKKTKPAKAGWIIWILLTIVLGVCVFLLLPKAVPGGYLGCCGLTLYASVLALMVVSAVKMPRLLSLAAYAFIVSDLLLIPDMVSPQLVWCHCISTFLFYLSLWLICCYLSASRQA